MFVRTRLVTTGTLAVLLLAARPAAAAWSANGNLACNAAGDQSNTLLVSDGSGGMFLIWQDDRSGTSDLYALRLTGNGVVSPGWPANGYAVCTAGGDQKLAVAAADGAGGFYLAWEDYRVPGGESDVYLQRVTGFATVAAGWPADGLPVCALAHSQGYPTLIADGTGAIVAWQDDRDGVSTDLYAQRINGAAAVQWAAGGVAICTAVGNQFFPSMVSDGAGGAFLAWQDARDGDPDVYAQRVNAAGAPQWSANGVPVCNALYEQLTPRMVPDGSGGVLVEWDDYRDLNSDVYAQRLNGSGVRQWATQGVALCNDLSEQYSSSFVTDGAGGGIVTWTDYRGLEGDLYAQRVNGSGTPQWLANGLVICNATGDQFDATAVPDLANGMYLVWSDARGGPGSADIFAKRVTSSGGTANGWQATGSLVCNAPDAQMRPAVLGDGAGCFVAWSDERGGVGTPDIYAWRAGGSSSVDVPSAPVVTALDFAPPFPNPAHGGSRGPGVTLRFQTAEITPARMTVFDLAGRRVRALLDDSNLAPGWHTVRWDLKEDSGSPAPAGLYLITLQTTAGPQVRKLTVVR